MIVKFFIYVKSGIHTGGNANIAFWFLKAPKNIQRLGAKKKKVKQKARISKVMFFLAEVFIFFYPS